MHEDEEQLELPEPTDPAKIPPDEGDAGVAEVAGQ